MFLFVKQLFYLFISNILSPIVSAVGVVVNMKEQMNFTGGVFKMFVSIIERTPHVQLIKLIYFVT